MEESKAYLSNASCFVGRSGEHTGCFYVHPSCPLPDAKEMLFQFLKIIGKIEDAAKAEQSKPEEEKNEEEAGI